MRANFLGFPVDSVDIQDTLQRVDEYIDSGPPRQILVSNANKLWMMSKQPRMAEVASRADLIVPERVLVLCAALRGVHLKSEVCGVALGKALLPHCENRGHSIFFLGARPDVIECVVAKVRQDHPKLRIAGHHHGYFLPDGNGTIRSMIKECAPDVLLVAMGSPLQEYWISEHLHDLGVPVVVGLGGTFDVIAGIKKDAPIWIRKSALEWLYRLAQDPKHLWRRYAITIPWLLGAVLSDFVNDARRTRG